MLSVDDKDGRPHEEHVPLKAEFDLTVDAENVLSDCLSVGPKEGVLQVGVNDEHF